MDLRDEVLTVLLAASPIVELRGAIPFAIVNGLPLFKSYILSILGNMLPVVPLFFLFDFLFKKLIRVKIIGKVLSWWFAKIEKKSRKVSLWGYLGLIVFVAIPFPTTGAWTGTLVARLLNFSLSKTVLAVFCGVLFSGIIVSLATLGVRVLF